MSRTGSRGSWASMYDYIWLGILVCMCMGICTMQLVREYSLPHLAKDINSLRPSGVVSIVDTLRKAPVGDEVGVANRAVAARYGGARKALHLSRCRIGRGGATALTSAGH